MDVVEGQWVKATRTVTYSTVYKAKMTGTTELLENASVVDVMREVAALEYTDDIETKVEALDGPPSDVFDHDELTEHQLKDHLALQKAIRDNQVMYVMSITGLPKELADKVVTKVQSGMDWTEALKQVDDESLEDEASIGDEVEDFLKSLSQSDANE